LLYSVSGWEFTPDLHVGGPNRALMDIDNISQAAGLQRGALLPPETRRATRGFPQDEAL
jgi:hypothetical protein